MATVSLIFHASKFSPAQDQHSSHSLKSENRSCKEWASYHMESFESKSIGSLDQQLG
jgi:hypothetical protein